MSSSTEFASQFFDQGSLDGGSSAQFQGDGSGGGGAGDYHGFQAPDEPDSDGNIIPSSHYSPNVQMADGNHPRNTVVEDPLDPGFEAPEDPPGEVVTHGRTDQGGDNIPQDLMAAAFARGITNERALAMGEENLRATVHLIDSNLHGAGVNANFNAQNWQPGQPGPYGGGNGQVNNNGQQGQGQGQGQGQDLNYDIPEFEKIQFELPEGADADDPAWKAVSTITDRFNSTIEPLINRLVQVEEALVEEYNEKLQNTFSAEVGKLGKGWASVFGEGGFDKLPPNSPERANLDRAFEYWRQVIIPQFPRQSPASVVLNAVAGLFPNHVANNAQDGVRKGILDGAGNKAGMTSHRPSQRKRVDTSVSPADRATARAAEYLEGLGTGSRRVGQL